MRLLQRLEQVANPCKVLLHSSSNVGNLTIPRFWTWWAWLCRYRLLLVLILLAFGKEPRTEHLVGSCEVAIGEENTSEGILHFFLYFEEVGVVDFGWIPTPDLGVHSTAIANEHESSPPFLSPLREPKLAGSGMGGWLLWFVAVVGFWFFNS